MKVIRTSNWMMSGETPGEDEYVVAGPGLTYEEASEKASELNAQDGVMSRDYFEAVDDYYRLQEFKP